MTARNGNITLDATRMNITINTPKGCIVELFNDIEEMVERFLLLAG